jgi:preprotein translocase subunit SecA
MSDRGALTQPGAYPERKHRRPSPVEKILWSLAYLPQSLLPRSSPSSIAARIRAARAGLADAAAELQTLRYELRKTGMRGELVARALALAGRSASALAMKPDDQQMAAAWLLIHEQGVELQAVEGRALACALAAAVVAMGGATVHVVVSMPYVARRDSAAMRPLFDALGLSSSCVDETLSAEKRKEAYACNVVYCVQRELGLDYLRDRLVLKGKPRAVRLRTELLTTQTPRSRNLMLRGLQFAIIDEADVVLIDAVQTPISISAEAETSQEVRWLGEALKLAGLLEDSKDYQVHEGKFVELTAAGGRKLADLARPMAGIWQGTERREEIVKLALVAHRVLQKDKHYAVNGQALQTDPQVLLMFGKQPSVVRMLRLMLELKEGCTPTATRETLARIAYQRFFTGYLKSAAIASDTSGIGAELWKVYRLRLTKLRPSLPQLWVGLPDRVARDREASAVNVVARIAELKDRGSPVLLVTRSHVACGFWSEALAKAGLEHQCLTGAQDEKEAAAFAQAAAPGRITIAPHFVARGCSVGRSEETEKLGGLRVIFVQLFPTRRHQRSLLRRSLPAGVPGSVQRMLALDDEILVNYAPAWWLGMRSAFMQGAMMRYCQWRFDRDNRAGRGELLRIEDYLGDLLAFSGGAE